jgi:hypothetical protein
VWYHLNVLVSLNNVRLANVHSPKISAGNLTIIHIHCYVIMFTISLYCQGYLIPINVDVDSRCSGTGRYICPDGVTCIASADAYTTCPGLTGTHLDWKLSPEAYATISHPFIYPFIRSEVHDGWWTMN